MFAVRIHGRGGQGAVTAAELLSVAAFDEGRHAQAFPSFGSRAHRRTRGRLLPDRRPPDPAPRPGRPTRTPLVVQDPTLLHQVTVLDGLGADGYRRRQHLARRSSELGLDELVDGCGRATW